MEREKKVTVIPGKLNEVDLTKEAANPAVLTLEAPGVIAIDAGSKKPIALKVKRENFKGDVKVTFTGLPAGVKVADLTIPEGKSEGNAEVSASKEAKAGPADIVAKADGGTIKAQVKIKLSVKPAEVVTPMPPQLILDTPSTFEVAAGSKKPLTINVQRKNFKGPVKVTFSGLPEGIKIPEQTIAEDKNAATVEIAPGKETRPGTVMVKVIASVGKVKVEAEIRFTVKGAAAPPKAALSIEKPAALEVPAGGKKNLHVKIKRDNVKGPVKVTFARVPKDIKIADLTIPEGKSEGNAEVAVAKDAKAGSAEVTIQAAAGDLKAQTPAKIDIKAAAKPKDK